jgi:spore coat polysaccharide biosynthesis predicted glycosyltransferase SpsG
MEGPSLRLHVDAADMAGLAAAADVAVGAGGSSAWERACLGLPAVTLILADNQRDLAWRMDADGLTLAVEVQAPDFEGRLGEAFLRLSRDGALRAAMSGRLAELCDGLGGARAAEAMLG